MAVKVEAEAAGAFHSGDSGLVAAPAVVVEAKAEPAEAVAVELAFRSDRIRARHH